ncbi:hypothetical protein BaRGS_00026233 [Batillaria attramentaria]|uniref:Uncharacterized protein n=1 Tax=Batillaria attramentaria TaxID=370345 RepID=A0ABD0K6S6_9CAEN
MYRALGAQRTGNAESTIILVLLSHWKVLFPLSCIFYLKTRNSISSTLTWTEPASGGHAALVKKHPDETEDGVQTFPVISNDLAGLRDQNIAKFYSTRIS